MRLGPADIGKGLIDYSRSIIALFKQKMGRPFWLWSAATADLPTESDQGANEGALAYDETLNTLTFYDGANWQAIWGIGATAADARTNLGLGAVATQGYTTGTFTPALDLGGAAVGVTYGGRGGRYTTIGRMVFVELFIVLTSKGTSVGTATITGLPFAAAAQASVSVLPIGLSGMTVPLGGVQPTQTKVDLYDFSGATVVAVNNTNLTNTSQISISATYSV